ncbi:MAG: DinB family protein [Bacteroidota bacterium]
MTHSELIDDSKRRMAKHIELATKTLPQLSHISFNKPPAPGKWSVAQVLAHILITLELYYGKMDPALERAQAVQGHEQQVYKMGFIGGQIVSWMQNPKRKFPKFKLIQPKAADAPEPIHESIVDDYLAALADFQQRLDHWAQYDLRKTRFPNPLFSPHKFQLGDAILEHVIHFERHWSQIERTIAAVEPPAKAPAA